MKTYEQILEQMKIATDTRDRMEPGTLSWYYYDGMRRSCELILNLEL